MGADGDVGLLGTLLRGRQLREARRLVQNHTAGRWGLPWAVLMQGAYLPTALSWGPGLTMGLPLPAGQGWAAGPLRASFWRRLGVIDRSLGNTIRLPRLGRAARQGRWEKHKASCKRLPRAQGRGRGWGRGWPLVWGLPECPCSGAPGTRRVPRWGPHSVGLETEAPRGVP